MIFQQFIVFPLNWSPGFGDLGLNDDCFSGTATGTLLCELGITVMQFQKRKLILANTAEIGWC